MYLPNVKYKQVQYRDCVKTKK